MHKLLKAPANFMVSGGESMDMTGINMAVESSSNSLTAWSMAFENLETSTMDVSMESTSTLKPSCVKRKKFVSDQSEGDDDEFKFPRSDFGDSKKQNHSEIEKRRRDKMNTYILELSSLVPMCKAMSRKLDKLTVLRMAVQHMKTLRGSIHSYTEGHYKPSFLSDEEVKRVILEAAEGFLFVVGCDRGRILFVSESVSQLLHYSQSDLLGQSWFDILHPKDVAKVKEQLSSPDLSPRERFIDAKTMLPVKTDVPHGHTRMCPGARRSFFCRVKCKTVPPLKEEADTTTGCHRRKKSPNSDRKYCVIHCTGYLKSWPPAKVGLQEDNDGDSSSCNLSCLVAVGRVQPLLPSLTSPSSSSPSTATVGKSHIPVQSIEYVSRHSVDGKFVFVDQRATLILGYLPQELLGTSCYEYYHQDDIQHLADTHKAVLQGLQQFVTQVFRFRTKDGSFLRLQTKWKAFRNPWTKDIEYLIARNTAIPTDSGQVESSISEGAQVSDSSLDSFLSTLPAGCAGGSIQRPIGSIRVGAGKIGRQIADKAQEVHRTNYSSSSSNSPVRTADPPLNGPSARRQETFSTLTLQQQSSSKQVQVPPPTPVIPVLLPPLVDVASSSSPMPPPLPNHCLRPLPPTSVPTVSLPQNNHGTFHPGIDGHFDRNLVARSTHPVNNVILDSGIQPDADVIDSLTGSHTLHAAAIQTSEGNDEAAMAVIMSLLEADAGLGGPVDFTGLPWPLP